MVDIFMKLINLIVFLKIIIFAFKQELCLSLMMQTLISRNNFKKTNWPHRTSWNLEKLLERHVDFTWNGC